MTTRDECAKALYDAYNAGGDPATANKNYRGEPCPEWDALPDNVREKWACAYDAALAMAVDAALDDDATGGDDQSDTAWAIEWPKGINFIPQHPPAELAEFIIAQNLAGLRWHYGSDSEDILADLADGITLYADCEDPPRVTVVADGDYDEGASTGAEVLAFLNGVADTGMRCGKPVGHTVENYIDAAIVLSQAMKKTAVLRASRTKTNG